jgi:serine/threonine protein kinase
MLTLIGSGGSSKVYYDSDSKYVVKVCAESLSHEWDILLLVRGQHAPTPISYTRNEIVMTRARGKTLNQMIQRVSDYDDFTHRVYRAILPVLKWFKHIGITHGDLNPSNIMFHNGKATVVDFEHTKLIYVDDYDLSYLFYHLAYMRLWTQSIDCGHNSIISFMKTHMKYIDVNNSILSDLSCVFKFRLG